MQILCKIENEYVTDRAYFEGSVPSGWIPVGQTWIANNVAQVGWSYANTTFTPPPEPPPEPVTTQDVTNERERRLSLGATVTLSTGKGPIPVQTRDEIDSRNLLTLQGQATNAVLLSSNTTFQFRDANDSNWSLSAFEMIELTAQVAAHGQYIFSKSWALKAMDPIPLDYATNDSYWE